MEGMGGMGDMRGMGGILQNKKADSSGCCPLFSVIVCSDDDYQRE